MASNDREALFVEDLLLAISCGGRAMAVESWLYELAELHLDKADAGEVRIASMVDEWLRA